MTKIIVNRKINLRSSMREIYKEQELLPQFVVKEIKVHSLRDGLIALELTFTVRMGTSRSTFLNPDGSKS